MKLFEIKTFNDNRAALGCIYCGKTPHPLDKLVFMIAAPDLHRLCYSLGFLHSLDHSSIVILNTKKKKKNDTDLYCTQYISITEKSLLNKNFQYSIRTLKNTPHKVRIPRPSNLYRQGPKSENWCIAKFLVVTSNSQLPSPAILNQGSKVPPEIAKGSSSCGVSASHLMVPGMHSFGANAI